METDSTTDIVYVLLLLQGAMGLLAGLGLLIFSGGNPLTLPLAIGKPVVLFALAAGAARRWRRVRKVTIVVEALSLAGFGVSALIGLLGEVDFTINLVTLITNIVLPMSVIILLTSPRRRTQPSALAAGSMNEVKS